MRSITEIVDRFKQNWTGELSSAAVAQACRDAGMTCHNSAPNPIVTIQIFFLQILHGNTACEHLSHLAGLSFTAAAYCRARMRLELEALRLLLGRCVEQLQQDTFDTGRWLGHRVFHVDDSSFSMPDTPELQAHFGQPGQQQPGCGFPTAHWLALLHVGTGMITKMLAAPLRTHNMSKTAQLHPELQAGDVLVADCGFCSFAHLALLLQRAVHGVLRIHQRTIVDFTAGRAHVLPGKGKSDRKKGKPRSRWLRQLGATDQIVEWFKPTTKPRWMSSQQFAALPAAIVVRELRYWIQENGFRPTEITLVSTLLDSERYSLSRLASLFCQRWQIETNFGHLKTTMNMDVLKCKTVRFSLVTLLLLTTGIAITLGVLAYQQRPRRVVPATAYTASPYFGLIQMARWLLSREQWVECPGTLIRWLVSTSRRRRRCSLAVSDDRRLWSSEVQHFTDIVPLVLTKYSTNETQHRYPPGAECRLSYIMPSRCVST